MRGLKSLPTAQALLDGWLIHYNFFRPHEGLDNRTPAEAAEVKYPFKDWLEVVQSQEAGATPMVGTLDSEIGDWMDREQKPKQKTKKKRKVEKENKIQTTLGRMR